MRATDNTTEPQAAKGSTAKGKTRQRFSQLILRDYLLYPQARLSLIRMMERNEVVNWNDFNKALLAYAKEHGY